MTTINFHIKNTANIGDIVSAPGLYSNQHGIPATPTDLSKITELHPTAIIIGGGAVIQKLNRQSLRFDVPSVIWGAGHTKRGLLQQPEYTLQAHYDLIGVRDAGTQYRWVPCCSCLSPLFDQQYPLTREFVVYQNTLTSSLPGADLGNDCLDLAHVISTLASAETVITSSYHGAYWATLLKRRVVAIPFGSKFYGLKHLPTMATWADRFKIPGRQHLTALQECREATMAFAADVRAFLQRHKVI